jgi:hypothetical protein
MCKYKEVMLNGVVKCNMDDGECGGEDECCWITGYFGEPDEFEATGQDESP